MARLTGLEPATPGVTGRYSNRLSYNRAIFFTFGRRRTVARLTGLEPATPGVTGRYSNRLSYNRVRRPVAAERGGVLRSLSGGVKRPREDFREVCDEAGDGAAATPERRQPSAVSPAPG